MYVWWLSFCLRSGGKTVEAYRPKPGLFLFRCAELRSSKQPVIQVVDKGRNRHILAIHGSNMSFSDIVSENCWLWNRLLRTSKLFSKSQKQTGLCPLCQYQLSPGQKQTVLCFLFFKISIKDIRCAKYEVLKNRFFHYLRKWNRVKNMFFQSECYRRKRAVHDIMSKSEKKRLAFLAGGECRSCAVFVHDIMNAKVVLLCKFL